MITRIGILDELTPAVAAWQAGISPGARRALLQGARLVRATALQNIRTLFRRTGRNRTGKGQRGLKIRADQQGGISTVRIWQSSGILAAQELGSRVPDAVIRQRHGTPLRKAIFRPGFTLPRRPFLEPAYRAQAGAIIAGLEAEYARLLATTPPALRT